MAGMLLPAMLVSSALQAQVRGFVPLELHGPRSVALMEQIDAHLANNAVSTGNAERDSWIRHVRARQATLLKRMVRARTFIRNDTLQAYVERYFARIAESNGLSSGQRLVLIMNSPERNAACYGSGVFIVTAGLLASMPDESSLAFILAHEVAHDELLHVQQTLRALSRERESRNPGAAFGRILLGDVSDNYIDAFRTTLYASAAMSRDHELQADSMALRLVQRAGYNPGAAGRALAALATLRQEPLRSLFSALDFKDFPFKTHWLDERLSIYHRKAANTFLWSFDSLRSHPRMERRIQALSTFYPDTDTWTCDRVVAQPKADSLQMLRVARLMAFQSLEAAYTTAQYDIAFFHCMRLLQEYPADAYLVSRSATILLDLYHAKNDGDLSSLARFTTNLGEGERLINNFLFNISKEELAELTYHFLNNRDNFDTGNKTHYYLLWQSCELTARVNVREKVETAYSSRFGERIEARLMK